MLAAQQKWVSGATVGSTTLENAASCLDINRFPDGGVGVGGGGDTAPTQPPSLRFAESGPAAAAAEPRLFLAGFSPPPCQRTSLRCGRFESKAAAGPQQRFVAATLALFQKRRGG